MRVSQQIRYAIYGLFDLAYNGGARPVPLLDVGRRQAIPARYLEQIFQKLRRAGLVTSKRGPGGGYQLARNPESIALSEIVCAVQGSALTLAESEAPPSASAPDFVWGLLRSDLEGVFAQRSVADLCREAAERGIPRIPGEPATYEI